MPIDNKLLRARVDTSIKFCQCNLNGVAAHDFVKIPLLEAFITTQNYETVFLSKMFLDSTIAHDDTILDVNGFSLLTADHPSNSKNRGVGMYFKESPPLFRRNDLSTMQECLRLITKNAFSHSSAGLQVRIMRN